MVSSVCFKTRIGDVKDEPLKIYPLDVHLKKKHSFVIWFSNSFVEQNLLLKIHMQLKIQKNQYLIALIEDYR